MNVFIMPPTLGVNLEKKVWLMTACALLITPQLRGVKVFVTRLYFSRTYTNELHCVRSRLASLL